MTNKRKKSFSFKGLFSNMLTVLMLMASVYLVGSSVQEWTKNHTSKQELNVLQAELKTLNIETVELEGIKEKLSNSDYVQNYARGKHLMSKSDEQVFILPKADD